MAYGSIKVDSIIWDNSGSDTTLSVSTIPSTVSPDFTTDITLSAAAPVKFADADSSHYISFQAPATIASNVALTWPAVAPTTGQVLKSSSTATTLEWANDSAPSNVTNFAIGTGAAAAANTDFDLSGTFAQNIVVVAQSATPTLDLSTGNYFTLTQNANVTSWTFSNPPASRCYGFLLELANVTYTTAWTLASGTIKWPADTAPTLAASKTHQIGFITKDGGTTYRAFSIVDYTT